MIFAIRSSDIYSPDFLNEAFLTRFDISSAIFQSIKVSHTLYLSLMAHSFF